MESTLTAPFHIPTHPPATLTTVSFPWYLSTSLYLIVYLHVMSISPTKAGIFVCLLINAFLAFRRIIGTQWVLSIYLSIEYVNIKWTSSFFFLSMLLWCTMIELIRLYIFLVLVLWIYYFHKSSTFYVPGVWMSILQHGSSGSGSLFLLSWLEHVITQCRSVSTPLFCSHFCLSCQWVKRFYHSSLLGNQWSFHL